MSGGLTVRVVDVGVLNDHIVRAVGIPAVRVCNLDSVETLSRC